MTSNEQLIFEKLCSVYPGAMTELTGLSRNSSGGRDFIISDVKAFNYDLVLNCSVKYTCMNKEKSPDALFFHNSKLYFIEFKEGKSAKDDVRLKIHEGITTLYHFVNKHLPSITRQQFMDLDINYAVVCRGDKHKATLSAEMLSALEHSSKKYSLKNLEGLILKNTAVFDEPRQLLKFLNRVSYGAITKITVFEYLGETQEFSLTA